MNSIDPKKEAARRQVSSTCSAWWIPGVITGRYGEIYPARKHRIFRIVQGYSWGRWSCIRDEYPEITKSFEPNAKGG